MTILVFSDTHLTNKFDNAKFNYLKKLIERLSIEDFVLDQSQHMLAKQCISPLRNMVHRYPLHQV